ncbi:LysR family transcriptional regulator [Noviherbaspirillum saxi]|uniref:LysR family transcriptional regulator n=1 Tax=Noviherbaspirillum saxi TaxID=2320863 RepID=A0A3A3FH82_9BURK|nr:LysR family transcriptional regulator [Noviherbaspirillum saxi]RJF92507.1 LysR family transcriptional regulator [Noviherbaspirillum saxi]
MEFRHLKYFVVLADELHFGRAAKRLAISQPPLSLNIQQLEASLGAALFERNSKSVKLTPAGVAFREIALRLLAEAAEGEERVRQIAKGAGSRVRIGIVGSMLFRGLPERLKAFQKLHPRVEVTLSEGNSSEQVDALIRGQIDLAFVHTERIPRELNRVIYVSEPFLCCLPSNHPMAGAESIDLRELSTEPLVMFSRSASPDYYERVLGLCEEQGFRPAVRHEVRHWLSVVSLVSKEMGIALVPRALADAGIGGVRFVPFGQSKYKSEVYLVWNERQMLAILPVLMHALNEAT